MTEIEPFIRAHIKSVDHLRAMLLLHHGSQSDWSALEIAIKLHLPPAVAGEVLAELQVAGLICPSAGEGRYRYQPRDEKLAQLMEVIVELDRERPVTLLNMIYSRPGDIQAFTEAFKLRREKGN